MPPPRPHLLARAKLVERLDRLLARSWAKGWLPEPALDTDAIFAAGSRGFAPEDEASGRSAEDVADFRERLARLCLAVREEARLNSLGRTFAFGQLTGAVRQRFALGALWRERPEILDTKLAPPILVIGQMRSGTTRIHRLLAADPAHSATRFCDSWMPAPGTPDWRAAKGLFMLGMGRLTNPWLDTIHPVTALQADEELGWLAAALNHSAYESQWTVPEFAAWSRARDPFPIYREFTRILRTDAAHHGNAHRPRVMKVPQFTEDLDVLLPTFPDARVVVSQRGDEDTLRSAVSLVANQMAIQSDEVDLSRIETDWRAKMATRHQRIDDALADFPGKVVWVDFDRLETDWASEIAAIYAGFDLDLSDAAIAAMIKERARAAKTPHRAHSRQLAKLAAA